MKALCELCQSRLNRNVFRILDCKNEKCKTISHHMPSINDYLCGECQTHAKTVREALLEIGIPYIVDAHLVRGLDYYTKTVYEIPHSSLGARDAICAGGRYDNLISRYWGPSIGSVGFAIGMEATILALENVTAKRINSLIRKFVARLPRCILFLSVKKQENNVSHCLIF